MFTTPAAPLDILSKGKGFRIGRWKSRVSGQPEVSGMIPSSTMGEEILTPGDGQVRAMLLLMTNPVRSAANSAQLEQAFASLDFLVAVDFYINETTRHAHIILPTPSPAEEPNYEIGLYSLSVRNVAKWSWPVESRTDCPHAWEVFSQLSARLMGAGGLPARDFDDFVFRQLAEGAVAKAKSWPGLTVEEVIAELGGSFGPERIVEMLLRIGSYGDGFGRRPDGLTLAKVKAAAHGIDLGPLRPRLREVLNTQSGMIELSAPLFINDLGRLRARMSAQACGDMVLIGRRDLRCSNSFMHNLPALVKGRNRCTLQVSRHDAARVGLADGSSARVTSRVGSVIAPVEVTEDLMPGVVSLPHGWGHDVEESQLSVAKAHAGVNTNFLTDDRAYDQASGTSVLFGTPVTIEPFARPGRAEAATVSPEAGAK